MAELIDRVHEALTTVLDPEIRRPITDLDMVRGVDAEDSPDGAVVTVTIALTTSGCPLKDTITRDVTNAAEGVEGVARATVSMTVMTDEERTALRTKLRGGIAEIGRAHV